MRRGGECGHAAYVARSIAGPQPVEAAAVVDQAQVRLEVELREAADVVISPVDVHAGRRAARSRALKCAPDNVDRGHPPAVAGEVHGLRARAAAKVERLAGRQCASALDEGGSISGTSSLSQGVKPTRYISR